MPTFNYGGQALIEGVMMRGRDAIAVALRHPDGRIVTATERLDSGFHGNRASRWPFVRGLVVLYETLVVGTRWLVRSASLSAAEEGVELGRGAIALMLALTLGIGIGIFFLVPLLLATATVGSNQNGLVQHLVEGLIRVGLFVGYLLLIARAPDVRRVFQYHGAEHMSIHALEAGDPLIVENVRKYPTAHQRCGTEFLVIVVALSIIAFSLVGRQDAVVMIGSRVVLIPVIAAVGYEILRAGARHRSNPFVHAILMPGIWVQMITTRQPTDDMIEVAIVSLEEALKADGEAVPEGSADFARAPLDPPVAAPAEGTAAAVIGAPVAAAIEAAIEAAGANLPAGASAGSSAGGPGPAAQDRSSMEGSSVHEFSEGSAGPTAGHDTAGGHDTARGHDMARGHDAARAPAPDEAAGRL